MWRLLSGSVCACVSLRVQTNRMGFTYTSETPQHHDTPFLLIHWVHSVNKEGVCGTVDAVGKTTWVWGAFQIENSVLCFSLYVVYVLEISSRCVILHYASEVLLKECEWGSFKRVSIRFVFLIVRCGCFGNILIHVVIAQRALCVRVCQSTNVGSQHLWDHAAGLHLERVRGCGLQAVSAKCYIIKIYVSKISSQLNMHHTGLVGKSRFQHPNSMYVGDDICKTNRCIV